MFARITWLEFRARRASDGLAILQEAVVPARRALPRNQGALLLQDLRQGNATLITLWETRLDAVQHANLTDNELDQLVPLLAGRPADETYEVLAADFGLP